MTSFNPSVNIVRDREKAHAYYPTKNAVDTYDFISDHFRDGLHSYNIIGSYGTGKSAFLLAFLQHLTEPQGHFSAVNGHFNECKKFEIVEIVGEYKSIVNLLATEFGVDSEEETVYRYITKRQQELRKKNSCLVIVIDEFGKILEFSARNNPERELYFIQKIAEYCNHESRNILFITTLHQNFDAYAVGLNDKDKKEWEKVKGRIHELPFNEPIEHLLELSSKVIESEFENRSPYKVSTALRKEINKCNLFDFSVELSEGYYEKLSPLEPLAAACLVICLQRYGQNERSLFNFLLSSEPHSIKKFHSDFPDDIYTTFEAYEYVTYNFYNILHSNRNPDFFKWREMSRAIDRIDNLFDNNVDEAQWITKSIGLLDIVHNKSARISREFVEMYSQEILGVDAPSTVIKELEEKHIIRFQNYRDSFVINEGTNIDVERLVRERIQSSDYNIDIVTALDGAFGFKYEIAKAISFLKGTPRIFQYVFQADSAIPRKELKGISGYILITNSDVTEQTDTKNGPIVCRIEETESFVNSLHQVEAINSILIEDDLDTVARNQIMEFQATLQSTIKARLKNYIYTDKAHWSYKGEVLRVKSGKELNRVLSEISDKLYPDCPIYLNELINKSKLSGSIHFAKKQLFAALIEKWDKPYLDFEQGRMPAERTIYNSLLVETGIHINEVNRSHFKAPSTSSSFYPLWLSSSKFIEDAQNSKRALDGFVDILREQPFGLSDGFIEFWMCTFLFINRNKFALYRDGVYLSDFSIEVAELLFKKPKAFRIKTFKQDEKSVAFFADYNRVMNLSTETSFGESSIVDIARSLILHYKKLSAFAKNTRDKRFTDRNTVLLREAIRSGRDLEVLLFDEIPRLWKNSDRDDFGKYLEHSLEQLNSTQSKLEIYVELMLKESAGFSSKSKKTLRSLLKARYQRLDINILNLAQKSLVSRINSEISDNGLWLRSLCQAILGKPLDQIVDTDLDNLKRLAQGRFDELNALLELSDLVIEDGGGVGIKYNIHSTDKRPSKLEQIILTKKELEEIKDLEIEIGILLKGRKGKIVKGVLSTILMKRK